MTEICLKHVTKRFKEKVIVENQTLTLTSGNIYGVVGYNGSGKTVWLKCLCGLERVSDGKIYVDNQLLGKELTFLPSVGVILETPGFLEQYSGFDNLKQLALVLNQITDDTIRQWMQAVGLDPWSKQKVKYYSLGMKQKLALAQAFMESPDVLLLDEPMNGLDKQSVQLIRNLLIELKKAGALIVLASHLEQDIQLLCDEVVYMGE